MDATLFEKGTVPKPRGSTLGITGTERPGVGGEVRSPQRLGSACRSHPCRLCATGAAPTGPGRRPVFLMPGILWKNGVAGFGMCRF